MFNKILVATDNSQSSQKIFEEALFLAKLTNANLLLLHVLSDEEIGYPDVTRLMEHLEEWERYEQQGLKLLHEYQGKATAAGVKTDFVQKSGTSGRTICELAQTSQVDLVVVGHRGVSGLQEFLQGSVSNYVLHHAPCSVMMVLSSQEKSSQREKILVAVDHSPTNHQAVEKAIALAKTTGATLNLLHVLSPDDPKAPKLKDRGKPEFDKKWHEFEQQGLELLQSRQAIAQATGVPTEYSQSIGNPGHTICEVARNGNADIIVTGRRNISGLSELILGSVSNYVIHHTPCSVLIVQHQTD